MTAQDFIQKAYDISNTMSVSGGAVEQMAALRQALRDAYTAAGKEQKGADSE